MEFENTGIRFFSIGLVLNQDDGSRLEKYYPFVMKELIKILSTHASNQPCSGLLVALLGFSYFNAGLHNFN